MRLFLTIAIFLLGLFDLFMAIGFLTDPQQSAVSFGIAATGNGGISSIRGDYTAYFGVTAFCMMWGAWRRNADLLLVPALLLGTTFLVRALDLALTGSYPGWQVPMAIEALHVVLLLAAWRMLPHHRLEEIAG